MNRYTALILALLMALLCVLPVSLAEETVTAETAATEATEAPAAEDQVLATLANGTQIMQSEVDAIANQVISYYANYGYDILSPGEFLQRQPRDAGSGSADRRRHGCH